MATADAVPLAAAGVNGSTRDAPVVSDLTTQEQQHTHPLTESSAPLQTQEDDQQTTSEVPRKSLFGPFPEPINPSHADQQPTLLPASDPIQASQSSGLIDPPIENGQEVGRSTLNFNPHEPMQPDQMNQPNTSDKPSLPPLTREKTAPAIGPATDKPTPVSKDSEIEGPALFITLLLSSTGARHPYKLDEKYLRKRNVTAEGNNPINISLYKLKELILRDWRDEWETKPSSPDSIRLISMGKMLNDKARLSDCGFTNGITPHIIHMTIKPQDIVDEEDAKMKAAGGSRSENERSPGCRCIIQ